MAGSGNEGRQSPAGLSLLTLGPPSGNTPLGGRIREGAWKVFPAPLLDHRGLLRVALVIGGGQTQGCGQTPWLPVHGSPAIRKRPPGRPAAPSREAGLQLTSPIVLSRGPQEPGEPVPPSCPHFRVHSPVYTKGKKAAET